MPKKLNKSESDKLLIVGEKGVIIFEKKSIQRFISSSEYKLKNALLNKDEQYLMVFDEKKIIIMPKIENVKNFDLKKEVRYIFSSPNFKNILIEFDREATLYNN